MHFVVKLILVFGPALAVLFPVGGCKPRATPPEGASALRAKVARGVKQSQEAGEQIEAALMRSDPKAVRVALGGASRGLTLVRSGFSGVKSAGTPGESHRGQTAQGPAAKLQVAQRGIDRMIRGMKTMRAALDGWSRDPHRAQRGVGRGLVVFKVGLTTLQGTTRSQKKSPCGCSDGQCQDKGGGAGGSCGGVAPPTHEAASAAPAYSSPRGAKGGCGCGGRRKAGRRKAARRPSAELCL